MNVSKFALRTWLLPADLWRNHIQASLFKIVTHVPKVMFVSFFSSRKFSNASSLVLFFVKIFFKHRSAGGLITDPFYRKAQEKTVKAIQSKENIRMYILVSDKYVWSYHDDVIKWKHFPRCWPFVRKIYRLPVISPQKGQWRGALMFFICSWINGLVNNEDLRRHHAHYDVTLMYFRGWIFVRLNYIKFAYNDSTTDTCDT